MRRLVPALAFLVVAHAAAAQMPPSIRKPIETARKNVAATNAQSGAVTQAATPAPAAAQTGASPAQAVPQAGKPPTAPARSALAPAARAQDSSKVTFDREVFSYVSEGRRDPFSSPIETGEIRPLIADLRVVGIIFDASGRNSVAVMRDMSTQEQYRVKAGQILGRAKVAQIKQDEVVMSINEYGFSRQESLKLIKQTKGKP